MSNLNIFYSKNHFTLLCALIFILSGNLTAGNSEQIDSLEKQLFNNTSDTEKINILESLIYLSYSNPDKCIEYAGMELELSKKNNILESQINSLNCLGYLHKVKGNYNKALEYLLKSYGLSKFLESENSDLSYKLAVSVAAQEVGDTYDYLYDFKSALKFYNISLEINKKYNFKEEMVKSYYNIGCLYHKFKYYQKAVEYLYEALKVDKDNSIMKGRINVATGDIYLDWGMNDDAMKNYYYAYNTGKIFNDKEVLLHSISKIGLINFKSDKIDEAINNFEKSLVFAKEVQDSLAVINSLSLLGECYLRNNSLDKAFYYFNESLKLSEEKNIESKISNNLHYIGRLDFEWQKYRESINNLEKSLNIALKIGFIEVMQKDYEFLSEAYLALNDYENAFEYHVLYTNLKDSLFNEITHQQVTEIQTKYETEKKEQEIKSLTQDKKIQMLEIQKNKTKMYSIVMISVLVIIITSLGINAYRKKQTKRKLFLQTIDTEEKERRRYSQDLHDGLGPLLSSVNLYILNVLNLMQEEDIKEIKLLERANELLENAIDDTKSIANNLTPRVISECGLFTALKLFFEKINSSGKIEIIYTISNEEKKLDETIEIILYRAILELVNNTIKHAGAEIIEININVKEKELSINYKDNGKGFDFEKTISNKKRGLGITNIINRINSINGSCEFDSKTGKGTSVKINLSLKA